MGIDEYFAKKHNIEQVFKFYHLEGLAKVYPSQFGVSDFYS